MLYTSNRKDVKRLSTKTSLLIVVAIVAIYILGTWLMGADYTETLRRISY